MWMSCYCMRTPFFLEKRCIKLLHQLTLTNNCIKKLLLRGSPIKLALLDWKTLLPIKFMNLFLKLISDKSCFVVSNLNEFGFLFTKGQVKQKISSGGKYVSVNIGPVQVVSSEQVIT